MSLVSPGVQINLIDESFFIPGRAATVPLIFIATADEKTQPDGETPALGTFEHNTVRLVTSLRQSLQLYGTPRFITSPAGEPHHGDARNEYGLDALNKYLSVGNRAFVVRVNVNLDDSLEGIKELWNRKIQVAADELNGLVTDFINEFNNENGLLPADPAFKTDVTASELKPLVDEVMAEVFDSYSFSSSEFQEAFLLDKTIPFPGFQEILFDTTGGNITETDATGLNNDNTVYGFEINIVDNGGTNDFIVSIEGQDAQTFGDLVALLESEIQLVTGDPETTVEIIAGRIRITSGLAGPTSEVEILSDGPSGTSALFANLNLFESFGTPVQGKGPNPLNIYLDDFTTIVGTYDGLDFLIDSNAPFTANDAEGLLLAAANDFDNTREFRNFTSLGSNDAARRAEIVQRIRQSIINPDNLIRSERFQYNIISAPGYWEVSNDLVVLAQEIREEAIVVADTPLNRPPTGPNGLLEWASDNRINNRAIAYYYPHGLTSNTDGATIMSSAASNALRVYAFNDRETELWFAPAGPQRGQAPQVTEIGYASGNLGSPTLFVREDVDQGTRDTLFEQRINFFSNIEGRGILVMAQNTTQAGTSALSKVNVFRLTAFIRRQLRRELFSFLFEPNDEITQENVLAVTNSFLGGLLGRRALLDFAAQIDDERTTGNELWVDIAIKPVGAVEFIFVDLRVVREDAEI